MIEDHHEHRTRRLSYLDEFRDRTHVRRLLELIGAQTTRQHVLMEVCGGQTHNLLRYGIPSLLPVKIQLVHGPGCPVCVTPARYIDSAVQLAFQEDVLLCTYADMIRVPGSAQSSLQLARAQGGEVHLIASPTEALELAARFPEKQVVLFAIGFETTAPGHAMAVMLARLKNLRNFSALVAQVLVPPALRAIAQDPQSRIDAFLAAGHVCAVMGTNEYHDLAEELRIPIVVTGFEPADLLLGISKAIEMLEANEWGVANAYPRAVARAGNLNARRLLEQVFTTCAMEWRGIGVIPNSGLVLRPEFSDFDALKRFHLSFGEEVSQCKAGEVLLGKIKPPACPFFAQGCTPANPLGAPMVSTEGACAAYYRYVKADRLEEGI